MSSRSPTTKLVRAPLRADAERNRVAIVRAAAAAFTEYGIEVPFEEIARRAGVGSATLYRRFPTRDALLAAALEDRIAAYADLVERAVGAVDPWTALCKLLYAICDIQAADAGLRDLLAMTDWSVDQLGEHAQRAFAGLAQLIIRAKDQGKLRADFQVDDIATLGMANAGIIAARGDASPEALKRHLDYLIDAFRAGPTELRP